MKESWQVVGGCGACVSYTVCAKRISQNYLRGVGKMIDLARDILWIGG